MKLLSAQFSPPSICALPLVRETKFHTHTTQAELVLLTFNHYLFSDSEQEN
jgi:hypothetical protein